MSLHEEVLRETSKRFGEAVVAVANGLTVSAYTTG